MKLLVVMMVALVNGRMSGGVNGGVNGRVNGRVELLVTLCSNGIVKFLVVLYKTTSNGSSSSD